VRIVTIVGNRPQFLKAAAVSGPLRARAEEVLVHTGQHHDDGLSGVFFRDLGLPTADRELGLGGGSNTAQCARMLDALEPILLELAPDRVLVYGDTNSTLAGGLAAAQAGVPVAHVEAGMRSFDPAMPEELNRVLCDHLADLLLCPSPTAVDNLAAEGLADKAELVGDVMVDVALRLAPMARRAREPLGRLGVEPGGYLLLTAHRAGNVDPPERLAALVAVLEALPLPVVLPLHPRTRGRLHQAGLLERVAALPGLHVVEPMGPMDFAALLYQARAVLTDSGGVQKEAYLARVPCITLRGRTEWVETVAAGFNHLVDLDVEAVLAALEQPLPAEHPALYGDGRAGERVAAALTLKSA